MNIKHLVEGEIKAATNHSIFVMLAVNLQAQVSQFSSCYFCAGM